MTRVFAVPEKNTKNAAAFKAKYKQFIFTAIIISMSFPALQFNWATFGHFRQLQMLEKNILKNNIAHAYLFCGPKHIGKTHSAIQFAKILQCKENGCGTCENCRLINNKNHSDTLIFEDENVINIESIRNFQEIFSRSGTHNYRILILSEIQRLSFPAQNAFLKFLEEPPKKVIFLMTSSASHTILSTILSRVRSLHFLPPRFDIHEHASLFPDISGDQITELLFLSQEKIGLMKMLYKEKNMLHAYKEICDKVKDFLSQKNIVDRFKYADYLAEKNDSIEPFFNILQFYIRTHFRLISEYASMMSPVYLSLPESLSMFKKINESLALLEKNVNKRLVLENLLLSF